MSNAARAEGVLRINTPSLSLDSLLEKKKKKKALGLNEGFSLCATATDIPND